MQELQTHLENISFGHNDTLRKKTWKAIRGLQEEEDIIKLFTVLHQEYSTLDTHINMYVENGMNRLSKGQPADVSKKYLQDLFITDPTMDRARLITSKGEIENVNVNCMDCYQRTPLHVVVGASTVPRLTSRYAT
ncbi:hypothetical protein HDV64DRAFT_187530 [Trichoderma sp. TUCIM 5745]